MAAPRRISASPTFFTPLFSPTSFSPDTGVGSAEKEAWNILLLFFFSVTNSAARIVFVMLVDKGLLQCLPKRSIETGLRLGASCFTRSSVRVWFGLIV